MEISKDFVRSRVETAAALRVSTKTLRRMELSGKAPPRIQISARIIGYRQSEIDKFLAARTISSAA